MDTKHIAIARKTEITLAEWKELVEYVGREDLALATRIFYMTFMNSTHTFDYLVPDHPEGYDHPEITAFLEKAGRVVAILLDYVPEVSVWYVAANIAGSFNKYWPHK